MVQNKKNFSPAKKSVDDTQNLDRKTQSKTLDSGRSQSASSSVSKNQTGLSKDRTDISKRDGNSRK